MKAIIQDAYGSADILQCTDLDKPATADKQMLLRTRDAGTDPDVWHLMTGLPYLVRFMGGLRKPKTRVLGWDIAGTVEAAAVTVSGATALQGVRDRGGVKPDDKVLVIGAAGVVGTFAMQIAEALGAETTGVCSSAKLDLVRSIGADHAIDYTRVDITDGRRRYDVILDTAGNPSLPDLRRAVAPPGNAGADRR